MTLLESLPLQLGTPAANFSLPGTDGQTHSLSNYSDAKILGIIFICNHCPYVHAVLSRLIAIQSDYADKGVQLVGINANDGSQYPDDNFSNMQKAVEEQGINFPYLHDESQEVARAYQAQCTPDLFIFDANRQLAYHGRIDDNWQEPDQVTRHELREALDTILAGESIPEDDQKPSIGCSIKWK